MFDGDLLEERARTTPERLALVSVATGERLTYAELNRRAETAAATLRSRLEPGARFGILAFNCTEFVELIFAARKAAVIAVPLSTRATAHELGQIAADCSMQLLFHGSEFAAVAGELEVERLPIEHREEGREPSRTLADPEAPVCLLYTSGTTGKPKGVMIPARQLYWNGYNTAVNWGLREDDVTQVFTPIYHAGGLAAFLVPVLCMGGTVVLHRTFDVEEVWSVMQRERCSVILGVPTIWKLLLESPSFATADLSHVRWFISGGAALPQGILEAYQRRGVVLKQGYGMTEVGVNCFTMTVEDSFRKAGSIGRPMMFTEIRLVVPGAPSVEPVEVPTGEVGEMWIRGPHVSAGYWQNEQATRDAYLPGGWFRTGDLARRDEEGFFYIAGRQKEMFISGGVNVYPAEVEAAILADRRVSDAAVVAVPDPTWGEVGVAFVVGTLGEEELSSHLEARLARYKLPKRYVFVSQLPRTAYGKVIKGELLALIERKAEGTVS